MIQINMPMPKCCGDCFALDDNGDYPFCLITKDQRGYTFNPYEKRMPTCPLKSQNPNCDAANHDAGGCLGYCHSENDDEPIDACKNCNRYTGNREGGNVMANQYDAYKPVKIDRYTYDCGNCGARVMYAYGLGTYSHGASESYEDWAVKQCNFCPKCGKAVKWNG